MTPAVPPDRSIDYIPVIDLAGALSGDHAQRRSVATAIDAVCRESGFLVVSGHGVDPDLVERIHRSTIELFAQPDEWKDRFDCPPESPALRGIHPPSTAGVGGRGRRERATTSARCSR